MLGQQPRYVEAAYLRRVLQRKQQCRLRAQLAPHSSRSFMISVLPCASERARSIPRFLRHFRTAARLLVGHALNSVFRRALIVLSTAC